MHSLSTTAHHSGALTLPAEALSMPTTLASKRWHAGWLALDNKVTRKLRRERHAGFRSPFQLLRLLTVAHPMGSTVVQDRLYLNLDALSSTQWHTPRWHC
jgi:hypothetical protein